MHYYMLRYFKNTHASDDGIPHIELGSYQMESPPWVPREGEFVRFRDPHPPNQPHSHDEVAGYVTNVVTMFYGTRTVIEVYLDPRKKLIVHISATRSVIGDKAAIDAIVRLGALTDVNYERAMEFGLITGATDTPLARLRALANVENVEVDSTKGIP